MSGVTVYVTDEEQWSATVVLAPSIVVAHVRIGDVSVCMSVEQAEQLRDQLAATLAEQDQATASAKV